MKSGRQHMHQITADKFRMFQCDLPLWFTRFFCTGGESHRIFRNRKNPAVRYSNPVGITPKIFDDITVAVKGFLYVWAPVLFIEIIFPFFPVIRITQLFTGRRKGKGAVFVKKRNAIYLPLNLSRRIATGIKNLPEDLRIFLSPVRPPPETMQCI